jgi:hypothetical protein
MARTGGTRRKGGPCELNYLILLHLAGALPGYLRPGSRIFLRPGGRAVHWIVSLGQIGWTAGECDRVDVIGAALSNHCIESVLQKRIGPPAAPTNAASRPGGPGVTRTPNPRFRKPMLYPVELRAHAKGDSAYDYRGYETAEAIVTESTTASLQAQKKGPSPTGQAFY